MSATDRTITLAAFIKAEFPAGNVLLCDGGTLSYSSETYTGYHSVFGTLYEADSFEAGFGDAAEGGKLTFAPNPDATVTDWWRTDLFDCRIRAWLGEVDADGVTVTSAEQIADLLVDTIERKQDAGGEDLLELGLIARSEKLFLRNEGNVCSERFHKSVWTGEAGFNNCTDLKGYLAWGAATPPRSSGTTAGGGLGWRP